MITIARVVGAHGLKGELTLALESDMVARFTPPLNVTVDLEPPLALTVTAFRLYGRLALVSTAQIHDRTEAEALIGCRLMVPDSDRWPLPAGRYYADDLVGLAVVAADGKTLGQVRRVLPGVAHDLLELSSGQLVPMVRAWVEIDLATHLVTVLQPLESVTDNAH
ncbi:MAG: ribosome maturation factor RimM [Sulfobacillus sp.]